jgi:hypothetical protein
MMIGALAGMSALVAAVATLVGAVTLGLFFSRGQPWGTWNDIASVVLMLATIPVALAVVLIQAHVFPFSGGIALIGIIGMVGVATAQGLLIANWRTFEQLLPWTLGFGAVVGVWYLLVGLVGTGTVLGGSLDIFAIGSGVGYIAIGIGFWRGGQRHPLTAAGAWTLLLASTLFLGWLGIGLVTGRIPVACCQ